MSKYLSIACLLFSFLLGTTGLIAGDERLLWKENLLVEVAGGPAVFGDRAAAVTKNGALFVFDHLGKLMWKTETKAPLVAAPSFDEEGRLWLADLSGQLTSFSIAGEPRQVYKNEKPFRATPLQIKGQVIVCDEDGNVSRIDAQNGKLISRVTLGSPVFSSGIVLADGALLQPSKDYKLFRIEADGQFRVWFSGSGVIFSCPASFGDGRIALTSMDHHLYVLKPDGKMQFRFKAQRWIISSPVIDESGRIYFGSYDKHFYAVDQSGRMAWRIDGQGGFNATAVIDDCGVVYTGDGSGRVYAVNRSGRVLWQFRTEDYVRSALALFSEHPVLLVASLDGYLYALKAEAPLSEKSLWSSYLGNERNSGQIRKR